MKIYILIFEDALVYSDFIFKTSRIEGSLFQKKVSSPKILNYASPWAASSLIIQSISY